MAEKMGWIKLKRFPVRSTSGTITVINSNEFLIIPYAQKETREIYKFNAHLNKLESYINYPQEFETRGHCTAYDKRKNKLYLYANTRGETKMVIIDMKSKEFIINKDCSIAASSASASINVDGITHVLGGKRNAKHAIWNDNRSRFDCIHIFHSYPGISSASIIHVPSKDILVLIGGFYSDEERYWYINHHSIGIWIFDMKTAEWRQIIKTVPWRQSKSVITSDEKYIIIAACNADAEGEDIYVLSIGGNDDTYKLNKCLIKSPMGGYHHLIRTGDNLRDEMTVIGYIKSMFNETEFINLTLPPVYIMQLIAKWYNTEMVHWMEWNVVRQENEHYMIPIKRILSSI